MIRRLPPPELLVEAPFLPDDFPRRLLRFKETLDISWDVLATCIGADPRQVWRWREGTKPSGDSLYALFLLADRQPGGVRLLLGEDGDRRRHPVIWLPADQAAPGEQAGGETPRR